MFVLVYMQLYSVRLLVHELQYWLYNDCNWVTSARGTLRSVVVSRCSM